MMKFICPKCKNDDVIATAKLTDPPIHCYRCNNCDYYSEQRDTVIETVFPIVQQSLSGSDDKSSSPKSCANCGGVYDCLDYGTHKGESKPDCWVGRT